VHPSIRREARVTDTERVPLVVVGAGAAGLMTAIHAGRAGVRGVVALDGARTLGAKILVAGGGRCNVTHHAVHERDYAGGTLRDELGLPR
jgi:predicted flavoprotein YhiN